MRDGSAEDRVKAAKGIHVVASKIGKDRTNSELLPFLAGGFFTTTAQNDHTIIGLYVTQVEHA